MKRAQSLYNSVRLLNFPHTTQSPKRRVGPHRLTFCAFLPFRNEENGWNMSVEADILLSCFGACCTLISMSTWDHKFTNCATANVADVTAGPSHRHCLWGPLLLWGRRKKKRPNPEFHPKTIVVVWHTHYQTRCQMNESSFFGYEKRPNKIIQNCSLCNGKRSGTNLWGGKITEKLPSVKFARKQDKLKNLIRAKSFETKHRVPRFSLQCWRVECKD